MSAPHWIRVGMVGAVAATMAACAPSAPAKAAPGPRQRGRTP